MDESIVETITRYGSVAEYVTDLYKTSSHAKVHEVILPQLRGTLADRSEELKHAVYENYQDFLTTTHAVEAVEADLLEIHTLLGRVGSTLDELNHRFATELGEQQARLGRLLERKAAMLEGAGVLPRDASQTEPVDLDAQARTAERRAKLQETLSYLLDAPSRLEVSLSQWDFEACVSLIEGVRAVRKDGLLRSALKGHDALRQFDETEARVVARLRQRLRDQSLSAAQTRGIVEHLRRVTSDERALSDLLASRAELASSRVAKELRAEGAAAAAQDACAFAFAAMRSTWDDISACFGHDAAALAAVLAWKIALLKGVLAGVSERLTAPTVRSNSLKVSTVATVHALYAAAVPSELACPFLVRRGLERVVATLTHPVSTSDKERLKELGYVVS